ncbi:MAG: hypothetical protein RBU21_04010 [FCB group bacterium]|jgi:hypothetical protein|nr:hypothetical protein [FCB group bacterium]
MDVKVDNDRTLSLETVPADALALAAAIDRKLSKQGRVINSLRIDGTDVLAEDCNLAAIALTETAVVEVATEDARALTDRILGELDEALAELPSACHALAAVFQGNAPTEGFEPFQQLAEIWSVIKTRQLDAANIMNCSMGEITVAGQSLQQMHEELNRYLEEAVQALEANDCVLLGDLLEYELAPRAQQEAEIVAALRRHIAQQSA